jgi:hypothetical protein
MRLKPERSGFAKFIFVLAGIIVLAGIGIGVLSVFFHKAYISVTPYHFTANVEESLQSTPDSTTLPYQKIEVTDTATKSVSATGSQHVENHASGTITIYNAYATTAQRLITNTRFQTSGGLIFKVHEPVMVPGYTMKAGVKVPGSVDAVVYADEAGEKYNIAASDFSLPGLTNAQQHTLIYAKSIAAMSGGFIGEQAVVDPTLRKQTVDGLKADLERSLREKISGATVSGSVVFPDTLAITYTENSDTVSGNSAAISVSGKAVAPAFDQNALAHQFATLANASYAGALQIDNPESLSVHIDPPSAIGTQNALTVAIAGTASLSAVFDKVALTNDLAGKNKSDIQSILPKYPSIASIDVKVYPFWLSSLPDSSKMQVSVVDTATTPAP